MPVENFRIVLLNNGQDSAKIEQLVGLMTRMYDYHTTPHPDWRTHSGWQQGSQQWLSRSAGSEDWFVALVYPPDSEIAGGYLLASFHYEAPLFIQNRYGYIADLWLNEEYRGQGAAELLLEKAYDWFRQQGVERLHLKVDIRNEHAHAFWRKQGFEDFQMVMRQNVGGG